MKYFPVKWNNAANWSPTLEDAIVFGFRLQRHPGRDIDIPDWYGPSEARLDLLPARKSVDKKGLNIQGDPPHNFICGHTGKIQSWDPVRLIKFNIQSV